VSLAARIFFSLFFLAKSSYAACDIPQFLRPVVVNKSFIPVVGYGAAIKAGASLQNCSFWRLQ